MKASSIYYGKKTLPFVTLSDLQSQILVCKKHVNSNFYQSLKVSAISKSKQEWPAQNQGSKRFYKKCATDNIATYFRRYFVGQKKYRY